MYHCTIDRNERAIDTNEQPSKNRAIDTNEQPSKNNVDGKMPQIHPCTERIIND